MPHCVAYKCSNQSNFNTNVSYHLLPKDKTTRQAWIDAIGRTDLPTRCSLCSDHFEPHSFDQSQELKRKLMPDVKILRKLAPGAIPTIFSHKSTARTPRLSSLNRARKKEHTEVCVCFSFLK